MKWQCLDFIVPAGLLWIFPELTVVRCARPHPTCMDEETDICKFARVRRTEPAN
jgi:hypothetical protein